MNEQRNPYIGPRVYTYDDRDYFFGREREARDLLARVMSQRLVLFYAQSGAGKSSLINARLIPQLREAGFAVLPVGRVGGELPAGLIEVDNIYHFNLMLSLDQSQGQLDRLAHLGLTDFLHGLVSEDGLHYAYDPSFGPDVDELTEPYPAVPYVLIVDQFEELITTYPDRWPEREDFFRQLNQAMLADPNLWVLLTLREDYLAALDPFARLMRDRLRARFYMQRLSAAAACRAVTKPAARAGRPFAPAVAEALVDDLRQVKLQHPDGTIFTELGPYVEPVQLQVVCYRLWENLGPETSEIAESDLLAVGDVNQSLADYYADRVSAVRIKSGISERTIRNWVEKQLITTTGMRGQVMMEPEESGGLTNEAIRLLQDAHLVRAEKRSGATWFELAHDRLVEPVRQDNAAWRRAKLSLLQRQAVLWAEQNRPEDLLLRGAALANAEAWVSGHANYLSPLDIEFLGLCRANRIREEEALALERAEAKARSAVRNRGFAIALAIVCLIAIIAATYAFIQRGKAVEQQQLAEASAAEAHQQRQLAEANAAEADQQRQLAEANAAEVDQQRQLAEANADVAYRQRQLAEANAAEAEANAAEADRRRQVAIDTFSASTAKAESQRLAFASLSIGSTNPTLAMLLALEAGQITDTLEAADALRSTLAVPGIEKSTLPQGGEVDQASWNEDGSRILAVSGDTVWVWNADRKQELFTLQHDGEVNLAKWNKDGSRILTVSGDTVWVWNAVTEQELFTLQHEGEVNLAKWNKDGNRILTASRDGMARVWDAVTGQELFVLQHDGGVNQASWSNDGSHILTVTDDNIVRIWDTVADLQVKEVEPAVILGKNQLSYELYGEEAWNKNTWTYQTTALSDGRVSLSYEYTGFHAWYQVEVFLEAFVTHNEDTIIIPLHKEGPVNCCNPPSGGFDYSDSITLDVHSGDTFGFRLGGKNFNAGPRLFGTLKVTGSDLSWSGSGPGTVNDPDAGAQTSWNDDESKILTVNGIVAQVWDAKTGQELLSLRHVGPLNQASWNKDGSRVLTASWDGTARIWDAQTGQEIFGVQHDGPVNQAMWNQDASQILTASDDGTARVWDVDKEQELFVLQHEAAIIQASWNSDSSRILTVSRYGTTQVWDADTGQESFILQDEGEVNLAKWNKDGNRILTVSRDGVARVWNADTGQESFVLRHVGEVNKINGNEDGSQILTDIVTQASWNKGDYNSCRRDVETGQVDDIVHPICQQALEMILELDDSERVYTYCRSSVEIGLAEEFIQPVCQQAVELTIDEQNAMTSQQLCLTLETNDMTGSAEKVCELAASRTTEIQSGETVSGTIQPGADYLWSFSGQEEQVVRIAMDEISGGLDPYLILLGPDGEVLVENDDSGGDLNARIYYLLPEDGTYLIVAKGYGDSAGEYALSLVVETL